MIGADGDIPWRIPEDFAHFKATTLGHTLVMGRATYDSIGRPLPGRTTIVHHPRPHVDGRAARPGARRALPRGGARGWRRSWPGDVMVVGGAQIYALALPRATHQVLTEVHQTPDGDTRYPPWDRHEWRETAREDHEGWSIVWWERR